jgi:hypothetical protein
VTSTLPSRPFYGWYVARFFATFLVVEATRLGVFVETSKYPGGGDLHRGVGGVAAQRPRAAVPWLCNRIDGRLVVLGMAVMASRSSQQRSSLTCG